MSFSRKLYEQLATEPDATQVLARLRRLPAFNTTAAKLLSHPFDEDESIAELEASFRSDPALASQLLVAANSPALGFRSQISTIRHSIAVLGLDRIRSLVTAIATSAYMRNFPRDYVRPIWTHAVATAVIAEHLSKYGDSVSGSSMYTAGLTHDLGRLGLLASDKEGYHCFLADEFRDKAESDRREHDAFGINHTEAGHFLTQLWGFPKALCEHAHNHHDESAVQTEEDHIVYHACQLATAMGYPEIRLRMPAELRAIGRWQNKMLGDSCREDVERHIREFVG